MRMAGLNSTFANEIRKLIIQVYMKAVVYNQYGTPEVLKLKDVAKPVAGDNEVLIKIKATAVNSGDLRLRKADPFAIRLFMGLTKPRINILGSAFSGEVETIGKNVTSFKVGDQVFGSSHMRFGTYAEYISISATAAIALKPANITHAEAAVIPFGGTTALYFIKKANIQPGQKVLINGAAGAVGSAAVQLAKYYGAEVTAVCGTDNISMVTMLGADNTIDYKKENVGNKMTAYDVIIDTVNKLTVSECLKHLKKNGVLILTAAGMPQMASATFNNLRGSNKAIMGVVKQTQDDVVFLKELLEAGKMKAVIDRSYPLAEIPAAHTYADKGQKKGSIVIVV